MKKVLVLVLCLALISALMVGFIGCNNTTDNNVNVIDEEGNPMQSDRIYDMPEGITFLSGGSSDVILNATIEPSTAVNKNVDWEIQWSDPESTFATGKTVTDYVTVTPDVDGSRTATVSCLQGFEDEVIVITVTTRDGGYFANCNVTFSGVPSGLSVDTGISTIDIDGVDITKLGTNNTYTFDLNLSNDIGSVGTDYDNFDVSCSALGTIAVGDLNVMTNPTSETWSNSSTVELSTIQGLFIEQCFINASGQLVIETGDLIENYYSEVNYPNAYETNYIEKFKNFTTYGGYSTLTHYFEIHIEELNSGVYEFLNVQLESSVQNASISPESIEF